MMKVKEWANFQSKRISQAQGPQPQGHSLVTNFSKICDFLIENKRKETEKTPGVEAK